MASQRWNRGCDTGEAVAAVGHVDRVTDEHVIIPQGRRVVTFTPFMLTPERDA